MTSLAVAENVYYMDATDGNDLNNGLSKATAWKTINKVNKSSFSPGDYILFKRGDTWREKLYNFSSGTPGNPITFDAYGSGNDPVILGSSEVIGVSSDWTYEGDNVWNRSLITECKIVVFDETHRGVEDSTPDSQHEWAWSNNELIVYATENPAYYYSSIEAGQRNNCVYVNTPDYIKIENIVTKFSNNNGIAIENTEGSVVYSCFSSYNASNGIFTYNANDTVIDSCIVHDNGTSFLNHGIYMNMEDSQGGYTSGGTVQNCTSYSNSGSGIKVREGSNVTFRYNLAYRNGAPGDVGGSGILIDWSASNCNVYYNISHSNYGSGIVVGSEATGTGSGNNIYNNVCYDNGYEWGCGIVVNLANTTVKNNILVKVTDASALRVHPDRVDTCTTDNNCFYGSGYLWKWGDNWHDNLADYQSSSGQDANSINQNPFFVLSLLSSG